MGIKVYPGILESGLHYPLVFVGCVVCWSVSTVAADSKVESKSMSDCSMGEVVIDTNNVPVSGLQAMSEIVRIPIVPYILIWFILIPSQVRHIATDSWIIKEFLNDGR